MHRKQYSLRQPQVGQKEAVVLLARRGVQQRGKRVGGGRRVRKESSAGREG